MGVILVFNLTPFVPLSLRGGTKERGKIEKRGKPLLNTPGASGVIITTYSYLGGGDKKGIA
jgi:hypothetical protein